MRGAANSADPHGPRVQPAQRVGHRTLRAFAVACALAALELAPAWARALGWAPRADFSARFAWLPANPTSDWPASGLRSAVAIAVLWTVWKLRGAHAAQALTRLAAGLLLLRAALGWWLPWRTRAARFESTDWFAEPGALGAPAPLSWFVWVGLIAVWAPKENGAIWGCSVALFAGAWAWWACGLADLGGCLIVAVLAAPLWLGYRAHSE